MTEDLGATKEHGLQAPAPWRGDALPMSPMNTGMSPGDLSVLAREAAKHLRSDPVYAEDLLKKIQLSLDDDVAIQQELQKAEAKKRRERWKDEPGQLHHLLRLLMLFGLASLVFVVVYGAPGLADVADRIKTTLVLLPAIAIATAFGLGVWSGRFCSLVFYVGSGNRKPLAGVATHWRVCEGENGSLLHVYGVFPASRWPGLMGVDVGGYHKFAVTHVVGESPLRITFALDPSDLGLWKLPRVQPHPSPHFSPVVGQRFVMTLVRRKWAAVCHFRAAGCSFAVAEVAADAHARHLMSVFCKADALRARSGRGAVRVASKGG